MYVLVNFIEPNIRNQEPSMTIAITASIIITAKSKVQVIFLLQERTILKHLNLIKKFKTMWNQHNVLYLFFL